MKHFKLLSLYLQNFCRVKAQLLITRGTFWVLVILLLNNFELICYLLNNNPSIFINLLYKLHSSGVRLVRGDLFINPNIRSFKILFLCFYVFLLQELYIVLLEASTSASNHCLKSRGVVSLGEILYPVQRRNNFLYKKRFILSCKILYTIHKTVYIAVCSDPATAFIFQKRLLTSKTPRNLEQKI